MTSKDIMDSGVRLVKPDDSIESIIELFRTGSSSGFVVVSPENVVLGVITTNDFFTKNKEIHIPTYLQMLKESRFEKNSDKELPYVAKQLINATASDLMNQSVFFAHSDTPLQSIAAVFAEGKQTIIPVVDASNKFLGAISQEKIFQYASEGTTAPQMFDKNFTRPVDEKLIFVKEDISSKFSYIARSKAHLWLSATMILFIIGFVLGIIFIVDPEPIVNLLQGNLDQLLERLF